MVPMADVRSNGFNWCNDEVVCPWCGYEHGDSWELDCDEDTIECDSCGKPFQYVRNVSVTYDTHRVYDDGEVDYYDEKLKEEQEDAEKA